jgi:hypothetical protein
VFSSNLTTPGVSFAAALRGGAAQQQPQARQVPEETPPHAPAKVSTPDPGDQQKSGQSVRIQTLSSQHLDSLLRAITVVQQIMTEINVAVSEE